MNETKNVAVIKLPWGTNEITVAHDAVGVQVPVVAAAAAAATATATVMAFL